ncbi:MAG TPA: hypothetical protein VGR62_25875 [Candidatus Binatia bacterium]|jgi:hypothetical protein|nr:hypothetical protein [Candidatus Binatia bacterium]
MTTIAAGMNLIRDAGSLLERSAQKLTSPANEDLAGAVTDVVTARLMFASGTLLLRETNEQTRHLLDILA